MKTKNIKKIVELVFDKIREEQLYNSPKISSNEEHIHDLVNPEMNKKFRKIVNIIFNKPELMNYISFYNESISIDLYGGSVNITTNSTYSSTVKVPNNYYIRITKQGYSIDISGFGVSRFKDETIYDELRDNTYEKYKKHKTKLVDTELNNMMTDYNLSRDYNLDELLKEK